MSVTIPFRLHRSAPPAEDHTKQGAQQSRTAAPDAGGPVPPRPPRPRRQQPTSAPAAAPTTVRLGRIGLGSAAAYLLLWALVLFVIEVLVFWLAHVALDRLGVLASVSRATATVLNEPVPRGGTLPALEFDALLPWAVSVAAVLAVLWLLTSLSVVLVHNCICALTGGPRLRLR